MITITGLNARRNITGTRLGHAYKKPLQIPLEFLHDTSGERGPVKMTHFGSWRTKQGRSDRGHYTLGGWVGWGWGGLGVVAARGKRERVIPNKWHTTAPQRHSLGDMPRWITPGILSGAEAVTWLPQPVTTDVSYAKLWKTGGRC